MTRKRKSIPDRLAALNQRIDLLAAKCPSTAANRRTLAGLRASVRVMEAAKKQFDETGHLPPYMQVKE